MTTWLWWQMQLAITPVSNLDSWIKTLLAGNNLTDNQAINVIEILRGI